MIVSLLHALFFYNQNAVSMYCRLGFAVKKGQVFSSEQVHPTWKNAPSVNRLKYVAAALVPQFQACIICYPVLICTVWKF